MITFTFGRSIAGFLCLSPTALAAPGHTLLREAFSLVTFCLDGNGRLGSAMLS